MHEMLPIRSVSGWRRIKPCMVRRKSFQISEHSDAELGYIWTSEGKHTPRAKAAIFVGFADNMSVWACWILKDRNTSVTNLWQIKFSEHEVTSSFRKRKMVEQLLSYNSTDFFYQHASDVKLVPFNNLHDGNYDKVYNDTMSGVVVLNVGSQENTYTRAIQGKWLHNKAKMFKVHDN